MKPPVRELPGLALADRATLFSALGELEAHCTTDVVPVTLGGRTARYLREPAAALIALRSSARKGRPAASMRTMGGYIGLPGEDFTAARADVVAALRRSSRDTAALRDCLTHQPAAGGAPAGHDPTGAVWPALVAHLAGLPPCPQLRAACGPALAALHRIADGAPADHDDQARHRAAAHLATRMTTRSTFVQVLTARGWPRRRIAAEIVTLAFAGWPSLSATIHSGRCLGATADAATDQAVTELLRIAAPGWLVVRECVEDVSLPGTASPLPARTLLMLSPWYLHRDPRGWNHPARYCPHRPQTRRSPWYLPFGAGARRCPAEAYARVFVRTALHRLPPAPPAAHIRPALTQGRSACLTSRAELERP